MTAPRPKRLTRQDRLKHDAIVRRAEAHDRRGELNRQRRQAKRAASKPRISPVLESTLQERAAGRCELCGKPLQGRCHRHHRKARSQGGTDITANLVLLHPTCHLVTVHGNPEWAKENGWIVPPHRNPKTVPVEIWTGRKVRLVAGGYEHIAA